MDFVLSTNAKTRLAGEPLIDFINYVESQIKLDGKVTVTKDEGLFLGTKAAASLLLEERQSCLSLPDEPEQ